jgi:peptidoglycan-N-acetylglucosamine deacetylase
MFKALAFGLLFVVTNASFLLLLTPTLARTLAFLGIYAAGNAIMLALLFIPGVGWLGVGRTSLADGRERRVALTFDDGPTIEVTPKVLDILRAKGAHATFFFVGREVEAHPEIARLVVSEGHAIGSHTYSHPPLFCFLTPRRLRSELARGQEAIRRVTGVTTTLFRSPVGLRHPLLAPTLEQAGLDFVLWSVRSYDTWSQDAGALGRSVLDRVRPGSIVLLHDRPGRGAPAMLAALPGIVDRLQAAGYGLVALQAPGPPAPSAGPREVQRSDGWTPSHERLRDHPGVQ